MVGFLALFLLKLFCLWKPFWFVPFGPCFNFTSLLLDQKETPTVASSHAALVLGLCLASAFMLLAVFATTFYYYKKRTQLFNPSHKVLLIKKDIPLEKPYVIRKTPAVRSPSSSQVNPFNKKSPSPTSGIQPSFSRESFFILKERTFCCVIDQYLICHIDIPCWLFRVLKL